MMLRGFLLLGLAALTSLNDQSALARDTKRSIAGVSEENGKGGAFHGRLGARARRAAISAPFVGSTLFERRDSII